MKKWLISLLIVCAFFLASCGKEEKKSDESGIEVEKGIMNVELTLPAGFFEGQSEEEIIAAAKEKGIKEAKVNEDGSVYYKMSKKEHSKMLKEMKSGIDESIQEISNGEDYPSIKKITYNQDLTEFNLTVVRESYDQGLESFAVYGLILSGMYYNIFNGVAEDDVEITFNFIDEATNEIYETSIYPDELEDAF